METLSDRLKAERNKRGWSQLYLASRAGVGETTIAALENNPARSTTKLVPIAKALRLNPEWLATGKGPKDPIIDPQTAYIVAESREDLAAQLLDKGPEEIGALMKLIAELATKQQG